MKKFLAWIVAIMSVVAVAVGFSACGETDPTQVRIYAPTGAPFVALADMWDEDLGGGVSATYKVITEENVRTAMMSGEAEFIVAPLNVGNAVHNAFVGGKNSVDYRLLNVTSWGVLYFVTNDTALRAREDCASATEFLAQFDGTTVSTIGLEAIPGKTAKYLFSGANADVTLKGETATNLQKAFVSASASSARTAAVFAQPALTAVKANATEEVRILGSVSGIYKELTGKDFPMAGTFVRADLCEKNPEVVRAVEERIKASVEKAESDIRAVADKIGKMETPPVPAAILPKAFASMNVTYRTASESKTAVVGLLESLGDTVRSDLTVAV